MKRKFYSFLALLLLITGGASAQTPITSTPDASKMYTIGTYGRGYVSCAENSIAAGVGADGAAKFVFVEHETNDKTYRYLYCVDTKQFVVNDPGVYPNSVNQNNNVLRLSSTDLGKIAEVTVNQNTSGGGNGTHPAYITSPEGYYLNIDGQDNSGATDRNVVLNKWDELDGGNQLAIVEAGDFSETDLKKATDLLDTYFSEHSKVTYTLVYDGKTVETATEISEKGANASLPASLDNGLMTYTYSPATIPETTTAEVTVTATWNGPFEISESFETASWYFLKLKALAYMCYMPESEPNAALPSTIPDNYSNAEWAFVGNPYSGFTIYNRGAGKDYVLGAPSNIGANDDSGGNSNAVMGTPGSQSIEKWTVKPSSNLDNGFYLYALGSHAINYRKGDAVNFWTGTDLGSTFKAEGEVVVYKKSAESYMNAPKNVVFGFDDASYDYLKGQYDELIGDNNESVDDWSAFVQECRDKPTIALTDGYYRIENNHYAGKLFGFDEKLNGLPDSNDPSTIVKVEKATGEDGKYYLSLQDQYLQAVTADHVLLRKEPVGYVIVSPSTGLVRFTANRAEYGYIHYNPDPDKGLLGWGAAAGASQWRMKKAESIDLALTAVGDASYATTYLPFPVTLTGDVQAYEVTGTTDRNGETYATTQLLGQAIPAGTPVVLISQSKAPSVTATIGEVAATASETASATPWLSGQYIRSIATVNSNGRTGEPAAATAATVTAGTDYVLQADPDDNTVIGFFRLADDGTLNANRAYIPGGMLTTSGVRGILLGQGSVTGIDRIDFEAAGKAAVYDLSGRRVQQADKGVFIVNGKKVVK